eukprot:gnl/TRDRNA2_/TRDRNA2_35062_c0_seq1.p1 gnl/TRDRNA2_/TRDRNA2_35062_c0~~gnl/TRDRNA2_/TRDRNA2_35062_c0_seq1.p1  ORF type:complete len:413 (+),score=111.37 gnl/TRDRNA2_/TRDRNA2_35062_c0_seq1:76-1239(+)
MAALPASSREAKLAAEIAIAEVELQNAVLNREEAERQLKSLQRSSSAAEMKRAHRALNRCTSIEMEARHRLDGLRSCEEEPVLECGGPDASDEPEPGPRTRLSLAGMQAEAEPGRVSLGGPHIDVPALRYPSREPRISSASSSSSSSSSGSRCSGCRSGASTTANGCGSSRVASQSSAEREQSEHAEKSTGLAVVQEVLGEQAAEEKEEEEEPEYCNEFDEQLEQYVEPPCSLSWDWPLSRPEKKARLLMIETIMSRDASTTKVALMSKHSRKVEGNFALVKEELGKKSEELRKAEAELRTAKKQAQEARDKCVQISATVASFREANDAQAAQLAASLNKLAQLPEAVKMGEVMSKYVGLQDSMLHILHSTCTKTLEGMGLSEAARI